LHMPPIKKCFIVFQTQPEINKNQIINQKN
jgi:hypothetical protein